MDKTRRPPRIDPPGPPLFLAMAAAGNQLFSVTSKRKNFFPPASMVTR